MNTVTRALLVLLDSNDDEKRKRVKNDNLHDLQRENLYNYKDMDGHTGTFKLTYLSAYRIL